MDFFGIIVGRNLTSNQFTINFSSQVYFAVDSLTCFAKCSCGWKLIVHFFIWSLWQQKSRLNHSLPWWVAEHNGSLKADRVVFCCLHMFSGVTWEGYKTCDFCSTVDLGFSSLPRSGWRVFSAGAEAEMSNSAPESVTVAPPRTCLF